MKGGGGGLLQRPVDILGILSFCCVCLFRGLAAANHGSSFIFFISFLRFFGPTFQGFSFFHYCLRFLMNSSVVILIQKLA